MLASLLVAFAAVVLHISCQGNGQSALDIVNNEPDLTILSQILEAENRDVQQDPSFDGIICAPTDAAFVQFFDSQGTTLDDVLKSSNVVSSIVGLHVIPPDGLPGGRPPPGQTSNATTLNSVDQLKISTDASGDVSVVDQTGNVAKVTSTMKSGDATLWKLDSVLMSSQTPENPLDVLKIDGVMTTTEEKKTSTDLIEYVSQFAELSIYEKMIQADVLNNELKKALVNPSKNYIVLIPTDDAWRSFFEDWNTDEESLLGGQGLDEILQMNVLKIDLSTLPDSGNTVSASTLSPGQSVLVSQLGEQTFVTAADSTRAATERQETVGSLQVWTIETVFVPLFLQTF